MADDTTKPLQERLEYAIKASKLSKKTKIDSVILKTDRLLSTIYLFNDDYEKFKAINFQNLKLSKKINDSLAFAVSNHNLGWYHHHSRVQNDSAYYYYSIAVKLYDRLGEFNRQIGVLLNMADIQETEKDYIGSEENAVKALRLLSKLPENDANLTRAWNLNNLLGIISLKLKLYDKALEYHKIASETTKKMSDGFLNSLFSKNNIAFIYREKGNLSEALNMYAEILNGKDFFDLDPLFYALVLDNYTYTKFLLNNYDKNVLIKSFNRAYKISDSLNDPITKLAVTIDLSKFYKTLKVKDSAFHYATESYKLAKETSSNDILLESMSVLSDITQGNESKKYLKEHIKLNDSLIANERAIRNKFGRIKFETDQIELENQRISRERFWLLMISGVLLLTLFLLYIIITQRSKNKELRFKQSQQEANEEIYNLMLSQQDKIDEARAGEKKRISEELHDGILGRLFGTRLSLDSFNFSEGKDAIQTRSKYISELKIIEEDIRKISHDLNTDFVSGSGFIDILKELIEAQTQAYQFKYTFDYTDDINWEMMTNKTKINIYRILQESLQNAYKHANATLIKISIQLKNDVICLAITDDGKGFDMNKSKKGIGLKNINSRVKEFNGNVKFDSEPNKGTTIKIEIPYTN
ncbi:MAG: ATP-binding protein [Gelidibacter sp.]